jgi:hypothetical protein
VVIGHVRIVILHAYQVLIVQVYLGIVLYVQQVVFVKNILGRNVEIFVSLQVHVPLIQHAQCVLVTIVLLQQSVAKIA